MGWLPPKSSVPLLPSGEISVRACALFSLPRLSSDPCELASAADVGSVAGIQLAVASEMGKRGSPKLQALS